MHRPIRALFVAVAVSFATAACGSSGNATSAATPAAPTSVATAGTGGAANGAGAPTRPPAVGASPSAAASPSASASAAAPAASPSAAAGANQAATVNMTDANQYQPATLTVQRGATVTWVNIGQTAHTVTDDPSKAANARDAVLPAGAQPWDSGNIGGGASYSYTFDTPGQYTYFCIPHESLGMIGRITVTG